MHRSRGDHAAQFEHEHRFLGRDHARNARRTRIAMTVTAVAMGVEIVAGWAYGSMALLADGFHMATHAGAIGVAALAYRIAAARSNDPRLAMGAGKVGDLAGFANAIVLGVVSLAIAWESLLRIASPQEVLYREAMIVAVLGLLVNIVCAFVLGHGGSAGHAHGHDHAGHAHEHGHGRPHDHSPADGVEDHNLRGAYLHVLADALTSVLAIAALFAGWTLGWRWIDPAVGLLGAAMIASWSVSLARQTAATLVDAPADPNLERKIRERLEVGGDRVCDLHLWRVGPGHLSAIVALVTHEPREPEIYKAKLADLRELSHLTVEVNRCTDARCAAA
ncbi:CDF family Co(II)/Ni(II) efflux transporter DmeF [Hansschlegelia beijingensis]|uniref:Cation diffusion facilitator family transporter n=1 Tax=Hansschlegelia beijingensis TaxID=1133344 RepID=A0A7W6D0X9_9HYPH|nr:CDF family Co(II)/Ni(II) efflux transporter DmeF [Hansschlegelia beijingensis]MBB3974665.1 cation diffusion facilitator family transporter [Hansschlegelia beijingensis]